MIDSDDIEVCGIVHSPHGWKTMHGFDTCQFLLPLDIYESDLRSCLRSDKEALAQLMRDLPRCNLRINDDEPDMDEIKLPKKLWRFCTQSVMGIPVDVLHSVLDGIIAESAVKTPMIIDVWADRHVTINKRLRVIFDEDTQIEVNVEVRVNTDDPWVNVAFRFDTDLDCIPK